MNDHEADTLQPDTELTADHTPLSVWVVRASTPTVLQQFLDSGCVGIGWLDSSSLQDRDELWECVRNNFPESRSNIMGQIRAFRFEMNKGDFVILPSIDEQSFRYGTIRGSCHSAAHIDDPSLHTLRGVSWTRRTLCVSELSAAFRRTLDTDRRIFGVKHTDEFLHLIAITPDEDGLEPENEDPSETGRQPFDPARIKVRSQPLLVSQLVSRVRHREIDLSPDFQRQAGIWSLQQKSRLIESLLLCIPIPVFYVAEDKEGNWAVVDGLQRTFTIYSFSKNEFSLKYLEYRQEFNGYNFEDLPRPMKRRINETQLHFNVIENGTPEEVMFNIFHRINTGGKPLNGQEIRHALHRGTNCRRMLSELAQSSEFRRATDESVKSHRMADQECVLRFLAFHIDPWETYSGTSLDVYLGQVMDKLEQSSIAERKILSMDFLRAMNAAYELFGEYAFRKSGLQGGPKTPISKPLFEAWSVALARCSDADICRLIDRREEVQDRFSQLVVADSDFEKAITSATATKWRIRKRFETVNELVRDMLQ